MKINWSEVDAYFFSSVDMKSSIGMASMLIINSSAVSEFHRDAGNRLGVRRFDNINEAIGA